MHRHCRDSCVIGNDDLRAKDDSGLTRAWDVLGLKLEALSDAERKEITSKVFNAREVRCVTTVD